jgi:hypothetical protein
MWYNLIAAKSDKKILSVHDDGRVIWHPYAEDVLNDDEEWVGESLIYRLVLKALWTKRDSPSSELTREITQQLKWYRDEAEAIHKNLTENKMEAVMASVQVLSIDGGWRGATSLMNLATERNGIS